MSFKNFRLNVVFRVTLLTVSIFIFASLIGTSGYMFTAIGMGVVVMIQVFYLIKLVESTNAEITKLLNYIRHDDFNNFYQLPIKGKAFEDLNNALNSVLFYFRDIRADKESQYRYLRTVIQHISIGILSFDRNGDVQIVNNAAKKLFRLPQVKKVEDIEAYSEELVKVFKSLETGQRSLVKIHNGGEIIELAVYAIELSLRSDDYKLITVQNIHSELEEKEMDAWQNLIRVLTHEIMNSVAPISSLAGTIDGEIEYLKEQVADEGVNEEDLEDVHMAARTIQRRSDSLIRFVSEFRNLTHVPVPSFEHVKVDELLHHVRTLMQNDFENSSIELEMSLPNSGLYITADPGLIEQVLINLIKNAVQALEKCFEQEDKKIWLLASLDEKSRPYIIVRDNGPGIEQETLSKIFIPFFTTKKTGSGIGLSLSRQIMLRHNGSLNVSSTPEEGTEFVLKF